MPELYRLGEWLIDAQIDELRAGDRVVKLEPRAMRLLVYLMANAGRPVPVPELLQHIWPDVVVGPDSVYQAIAQLRRAFGEHPEEPRYIALVPRKGYRLIAPVAPAAAGEAAPATARAQPGRTSPRRRLALAGVAALAAVAGVLGARGLIAPSERPPPDRPAATPRAPVRSASVAVMPFADATQPANFGYFADGLTDELISQLSREPALRVPARASAFYFSGKDAGASEIGRRLNVEHLLQGTVRRDGERLQVSVRLVRAADGTPLWSQQFDGRLAEAVAIEDEIVRHVKGALGVPAGPERAPRVASARSASAHNRLLECEFFVRRSTSTDADKAVSCFRQVVAAAPDDAVAWSGLADALLRQPSLVGGSIEGRREGAQAAVKAAREALRLDPALAAPHATIAYADIRIAHDWDAAAAELRAALASEPDDAPSLLAACQLARDLGRHEEAIRHCLRAAERDPLNFLPPTRLAILYLYLGRLDDAEAAVRKRLDLAPESEGAYMQLADVLLARKAPEAALAAIEHVQSREQQLLGRSFIYVALGRRAQANAALAEFKRKFAADAPTEVAEVFAYRGEFDRAFAMLNEALQRSDPELFTIKSDSYFKPLEADPRYHALLERLNLPD